jgi:hypothetical protein
MITLWGGENGFMYPCLFQRVQCSAFICIFAFHSDSFLLLLLMHQRTLLLFSAAWQAGNIRSPPQLIRVYTGDSHSYYLPSLHTDGLTSYTGHR